ncbi:MAG: LLM class flavin-dependent oxidoreductase [Myxococcota bacterium]|nr:LLM class flavin-dependent oxidoreductase [Myxococcota bacterium]
MFLMRFDMRAPGFGQASADELHRAALEMAEWGEKQGCIQLVLSEHHGSDDGYLPSPLVMAAAMAGRTRNIPIQVAALVLPLHDPIRLAEDMAVLDIASQGRVSYVVAVGYRPEEYAMFGQSFEGRGRRMEASIEALRRAWTGEPFDYEGRRVRVSPLPRTPGGPALLMGGNSKIVARRAARLGLGMIAGGTNRDLELLYRDACAEFEQPPGFFVNPEPGAITAGFVSEDPDRAWAEIGPYLLHDANMYGRWMGEENARKTGQWATTVEELRAARGIYRILTPDEAVDHIRAHGIWVTHPLCGGIPPRMAWPFLEVLINQVLPGVRGAQPGEP